MNLNDTFIAQNDMFILHLFFSFYTRAEHISSTQLMKAHFGAPATWITILMVKLKTMHIIKT